MIGLPPFEAGADHETRAEMFAGVAITAVGAAGTTRGVTAEDTAEAGPAPRTFRATTVNVYAVPLVSPLTVQLEPVVEQVRPPGQEVAT